MQTTTNWSGPGPRKAPVVDEKENRQVREIQTKIAILKASTEHEKRLLDLHRRTDKNTPGWFDVESGYVASLNMKRKVLPFLESELGSLEPKPNGPFSLNNPPQRSMPQASLDNILELQNKSTVLQTSIELERTQLESFRRFTTGLPPGWDDMARLQAQSLASKEQLLPQLLDSLREMTVQLNMPASRHVNHSVSTQNVGQSHPRLSSTPPQHQAMKPPASPQVGPPKIQPNLMSTIIAHADQPFSILRYVFGNNMQIVEYIEENRSELLRRREEQITQQRQAQREEQQGTARDVQAEERYEPQAGPPRHPERRASVAPGPSANMSAAMQQAPVQARDVQAGVGYEPHAGTVLNPERRMFPAPNDKQQQQQQQQAARSQQQSMMRDKGVRYGPQSGLAPDPEHRTLQHPNDIQQQQQALQQQQQHLKQQSIMRDLREGVRYDPQAGPAFNPERRMSPAPNHMQQLQAQRLQPQAMAQDVQRVQQQSMPRDGQVEVRYEPQMGSPSEPERSTSPALNPMEHQQQAQRLQHQSMAQDELHFGSAFNSEHRASPSPSLMQQEAQRLEQEASLTAWTQAARDVQEEVRYESHIGSAFNSERNESPSPNLMQQQEAQRLEQEASSTVWLQAARDVQEEVRYESHFGSAFNSEHNESPSPNLMQQQEAQRLEQEAFSTLWVQAARDVREEVRYGPQAGPAIVPEHFTSPTPENMQQQSLQQQATAQARDVPSGVRYEPHLGPAFNPERRMSPALNHSQQLQAQRLRLQAMAQDVQRVQQQPMPQAGPAPDPERHTLSSSNHMQQQQAQRHQQEARTWAQEVRDVQAGARYAAQAGPAARMSPALRSPANVLPTPNLQQQQQVQRLQQQTAAQAQVRDGQAGDRFGPHAGPTADHGRRTSSSPNRMQQQKPDRIQQWVMTQSRVERPGERYNPQAGPGPNPGHPGPRPANMSPAPKPMQQQQQQPHLQQQPLARPSLNDLD